MKIIFLDIDGVLNTYTTFGDMFDKYEQQFIDRLNYITDVTQAKIVLSSTWRLRMSVKQIREMFNEMGITGEVISRTPRLKYGPNNGSYIARGQEINQWLLCWGGEEIEDFVILDDDGDMEPHMDKLILSNMERGLCENIMKSVIKRLK